jgi:hypothetical protein
VLVSEATDRAFSLVQMQQALVKFNGETTEEHTKYKKQTGNLEFVPCVNLAPVFLNNILSSKSKQTSQNMSVFKNAHMMPANTSDTTLRQCVGHACEITLYTDENNCGAPNKFLHEVLLANGTLVNENGTRGSMLITGTDEMGNTVSLDPESILSIANNIKDKWNNIEVSPALRSLDSNNSKETIKVGISVKRKKLESTSSTATAPRTKSQKCK